MHNCIALVVFSNAEKKRLLLCDWIQAYEPSMFKITLLKLYPHKWAKLTHSQILGVLTHLGIKLDTFGDITMMRMERGSFC